MEIDLSEALGELRFELYQAQQASQGQQLRFEVEKAELELAVEFRRDASGKLKVSVGAFGGEAGGGQGSVRKQRLTLTLNVRDEAEQGARARVSRAEVSGPADVPDDLDESSGAPGQAETQGVAASVRPWDR
ncbi:trypco2 family protein [Streptomyces sioyaensis]|uniref:trypco2 family protein n=1 Tax=Streptomyces sioyaensis TaxID=67364 RepID=UPI0037211348